MSPIEHFLASTGVGNMERDLVTGLFALGGAFLGAYFTRQAQHHKWLLERQSEAFARFLELIDVAHRKASDILFDRSLVAGAQRDLKIVDAYQPVFNQARIVRLYLPNTERVEFSALVKSYWALHTDPELGDRRLTTMDEKLDRIQELFEEELSPHFWLRAPGRWIRRLTPKSRGTR